MKFMKFCALSAISLMASFAFADAANVCIFFSTQGPDTYADGTEVLDGERYALVAVLAGQEFGGFNANGTATLASDKVLTVAPFAKGGRLPPTLFQADAADASGKDLKVFLLDTRTSATSVPPASTPVSDLVLNGATEIKDSSVSASTSSSMMTGDTSAISPAITDFAIVGNQAVITVDNVRPGLNYRVLGGLNRDAELTTTEVSNNPDGTITLKVDKDGAAVFSIRAN